MGWLSRAKRRLKKNLKKVKLKSIAKAVTKLATGASVIMPPPFNAIAGTVAKASKSLKEADSKIKQIKKAKSDYDNSTKQKQLSTAYSNARKHYKLAVKHKKAGNKKSAYMEYRNAVSWKRKGDAIK